VTADVTTNSSPRAARGDESGTGAAVERADPDTKLAPPVRKALLALIVGGIAAILDSTLVTLAIHTLVVALHSTPWDDPMGHLRLSAGDGRRDPGRGVGGAPLGR
jgi:hypothetical protein